MDNSKSYIELSKKCMKCLRLWIYLHNICAYIRIVQIKIKLGEEKNKTQQYLTPEYILNWSLVTVGSCAISLKTNFRPKIFIWFTSVLCMRKILEPNRSYFKKMSNIFCWVQLFWTSVLLLVTIVEIQMEMCLVFI